MNLTSFPQQAVRFGMSVTGVRHSSHSSVHFIKSRFSPNGHFRIPTHPTHGRVCRKKRGNVLGIVMGLIGSKLEPFLRGPGVNGNSWGI